MKTNKMFALKLSAAVVAALFATGAQANGIVSPNAAGLNGSVVYAMEDINAAPLVLPPIGYAIGVGRALNAGQDTVIRYNLPAGVTFAATPAVPVLSGTGAATITFLRGGAGSSEAVYLVSAITTAIIPTDAFTLTGATITTGTHGMTTNGSTLSVQVTLLNPAETACVDNAGTPATCFLTSRVASLAPASDFWNTVTGAVGVASDTGTTTDVNKTIPLAGFVVANDDTATVARATVQVANSLGPMNVTNSASYTLGATDIVTITITDPTGFLGLAAGGLFYDLNNNGTAQADETFAISGSTATKTFAGNHAGFGTDKLVNYTSNATTPMGVARTLAIAGGVAPVAGIAHAYTGNTAWWVWGSNGTILETAFFSNAVGYNNRFSFMNYGTAAVTYTATCLVEAGKTAAAGSAAAGTLLPGAQTVILAANVCTVTGTATASGNTAARGSVRFTINAPSAIVKGVYNSVNNTTGAVDSVELVRPTTNANQN